MDSDVKITKVDGQTGVSRPSAEGILAIIAPCEKGLLATPAGYTKGDGVFADFGNGASSEYAAYVLDVTQNSVVVVGTAASTPGSFGSPTYTSAGTSVITTDVTGPKPLDDYDVLLTIVDGGVRGTSGVAYTYSLDGGISTSPKQALGTAVSITIPNSGVVLALGTGTLPAGSTMAVKAVGPVMSNSDVAVALEALRVSSAQFEGILIAGVSTPAMMASLQSWIDAREAEGREYHGYVNTRMRLAGESDATLKAALDTLYGSTATPSLSVGSDGGRVTSLLSNRRSYVRPVALGLAARAMQVNISVMPSRVSDGPIKGFDILDSRGTPAFHDEGVNPGLANSRFTVFRTRNGKTGTYIHLPFLFSAVGSDYVFLPHVRTMNRAASIARQALIDELSKGERKGANGFILESDAQRIESTVSVPLTSQLKTPKYVSDTGFNLSRTDDVSSNAGATITGDVWIVALIYVTNINVQAKFLRKISV